MDATKKPDRRPSGNESAVMGSLEIVQPEFSSIEKVITHPDSNGQLGLTEWWYFYRGMTKRCKSKD